VTLNLNTWQRMTLLTMVNNVKGDLRTVRKALKALDVLELDAAEREAVGLTEHPNGAVTWTDAAHRFELEVDDNTAAFLRQQVEAKTDWPVSADVVDLCEQLGVKEDE
jgi:hypothetical protein